MEISEYVRGPWLEFSSANNLRSLPSVKDGQILTTRKLLWSLRNASEFDTVERLGLKAASDTAYKNGGSSICGALTGMVKGYPGTNNVTLFDGEGQFGTPVDNDASADRYISAKISENFRRWFKKEDDDILEMRIERGKSLEPVAMIPTAPLCLVNGAFGIGTGYMCHIHPHNPKDIIGAVIGLLETGEFTSDLKPWWKGWKGVIEKDQTNRNRFFVTGMYEKINATELKITELPPVYDWAKYKKQVLTQLLDDPESPIMEVVNDSNESTGWDIKIVFKRGTLSKLSHDEIVSLLSLKTSVTHTLSLWDINDKIKQYESIEELLTDWAMWRVGLYEVRRKHIIKTLEESIRWETLKYKVIEAVISTRQYALEDQDITRMMADGGYTDQESLDKIMNIPLRQMTQQGLVRSSMLVARYKSSLEKYTTTNAEEMMKSELVELLDYYKGW